MYKFEGRKRGKKRGEGEGEGGGNIRRKRIKKLESLKKKDNNFYPSKLFPCFPVLFLHLFILLLSLSLCYVSSLFFTLKKRGGAIYALPT